MYQSRIKLLILFVTSTVLACSGPKIDLDTDEADYITRENSIIYYKGEVFNGTLVEYHDEEKTKLYFERRIKDGKDDGKSISYFEDGTIDEYFEASNGNRDGKYFGNHENGQLAVEGEYSEDKRNGTWTWYHKNGNISGIVDYINGQYSGRRLEFYEDNSPKFERYYTVDGERDGEWREFFESGQIKERSNWNNGVQIGEYYLARTENIMSRKGQYDDNGEKTGTWEEYGYDGGFEFIADYKDGKYHGEYIQYNDLGEISSITNYEDGEYHGLYTDYIDYDEGTISEEGNYANGRKVGEWNDYRRDYDNDKVYLWNKEYYDENSKLVREVYYKMDGSIELEYTYN